MKHLSLWIFLSILFGGRMTSVAAEWQWSVQIPSMISQETEAHPQAFLWIPDDCGQVKAVVVGQHNMCEETKTRYSASGCRKRASPWCGLRLYLIFLGM